MISRTVKHYRAPLERGSRRERIRSGHGLPLSGPMVCWRNDGITCEPQRRPPEATGVVLDEHIFQTEKLSRKANGEAAWNLFGVVSFFGEIFPTRLIDIDRLHQKKKTRVSFRMTQTFVILIEHPGFLEPVPYHEFYFIMRHHKGTM